MIRAAAPAPSARAGVAASVLEQHALLEPPYRSAGRSTRYRFEVWIRSGESNPTVVANGSPFPRPTTLP